MKNINNYLRRIIALSLSLIVVASSYIGVTNTIFAITDNSDKITLTKNDNSTTLPAGYSVVESFKVKMKKSTSVNPVDTTIFGNGLDTNEKKLAALTDGTANVELTMGPQDSFAEGSTSVTKLYTDGQEVWADIIYTLKGECDISGIGVIGHNNGLWKTSYKLYASNDVNSLFNAENHLYTHDATTSKDKRTQYYTLNGVTAKYVAMRVTAVTTGSVSDYSQWNKSVIYLRLYDFSVHGSEIQQTEKIKLSQNNNDSSLPKGSSVVKGYKVKMKRPSSSNAVETKIYGTGLNTDEKILAALTDGTANVELTMDGQDSFAEGSTSVTKLYTDGQEVWADIIYTLKGECDISGIGVIGHNNGLWKTSYKLYASNDVNSLFNAENHLYTHDATTSKDKRTQYYTLNGVTAKYVAMRVTAVTTGSVSDYSQWNKSIIYLRLYDFSVHGSEIQQTENYSATTTIPSGENILKGKIPLVSTVSTKEPNRNYTPIETGTNLYSNMTDGNTSTKFDAGDGAYANPTWVGWDENTNSGYVVKDGSVYTDIYYELKGTATIEKFYVCHAIGKTTTGEFKIYASNTLQDLYTQPVVTIKNTNKSPANIYEPKTPLTGIRHVAIRITNPISTDDYTTNPFIITKESVEKNNGHNVYPRIAEIALIGSIEKDVYKFQKVVNSISSTMPSEIVLTGLDNLSKNVSTNLIAYNVTKDAYLSSQLIFGENIKDGKLNTEADLRPYFAEYVEDEGVKDYTTGKQRYVDVFYNFRSPVDLNYIVVGNHKDNNLVTGYYEIYISNTRSELFNEDPYAVIDNKTYFKNNGTNNKVNVICFDKTDTVEDTARFVGIRIYNPISVEVGSNQVTTVTPDQNNIYPRIMEFTVYGKYKDVSFDPTKSDYVDTKNVDLSKLEESYGKNLLSPEMLTAYYNGRVVVRNDGTTQAKIYTKIDEVFELDPEERNTSHIDIDGSGGGIVDLVFRVPDYEMTDFEGFCIQNMFKLSNSHTCSEYMVYVGEEKEDLFQTPVFHYNLDDYDHTQGQLVSFDPENLPRGQYFAIRIVNPVNTALNETYWRSSVIYAWGAEADIKAVPANLAENMPCNINLIKGKKRTEVSEKNLSANELMQITDSNVTVDENNIKTYTSKLNTSGVISTNGNTLELVYNLCGNMEVDKLLVSTLINSTTGFTTMKVYCSDVLDGVHSSDALIWTYKVGDLQGTISPSKFFNTPKNMRYVRFVFYGTKEKVQLNTIDVIGLDNQKMKTRVLTNSISEDNISINRKTGKNIVGYSVYEGLKDTLFDGEELTFLPLNSGTVGKDTYIMEIYLGDLRTVSNIEMGFIYHFEDYWPQKVKVSLVETQEELTTSKKADYTFTLKDIKDSKWSKQIRPRLARYVKIELVEFAKIPELKRKDGTYGIGATISELRILGTKVKGLQTSETSDELLSFTDKKTKIKATINRLDINDIYTQVVGIKVTPEKATNSQMRSLEITPFYKIIDKTIYKIELLDFYNNVVKNIGGRTISVTFDIPKNYDESKIMIGGANDESKIAVYETISNKGKATSKIEWSDNDNKVVLLGLTTADDAYWDSIGEVDGELPDVEYNEWLTDSIYTTDNRFVVTPVGFSFENGTRFTAIDISDQISDEEYLNIQQMLPDKEVAVFYDFKLQLNMNSIDLYGNYADIEYTLPSFVSNNYSELQVLHVDDVGNISELWSSEQEGILSLQLNQMGRVAIVGRRTGDGPISIIDSPNTGEKVESIISIIVLLTAAAYVVTVTSKSENFEKL